MRSNIVALLLSLSSLCVAQSGPNIIVLLFDDMGFDLVNADTVEIGDGQRYPIDMKYMRDSLPTVGATFTNAFATPVCGPSRTALLTGKYMYRGYHGFGWIHRDERTTGHNAKWAGYKTSIVGKWQLDGVQNYPNVSDVIVEDTLPRRLGWDRYMLFEAYNTQLVRYTKPNYFIDGSYLQFDTTDYGPRITLDTVKAMISRHNAAGEKFYIQYMNALPHGTFEPPLGHPDFPMILTGENGGNGRDEYFTAMCEYADSLVWELYQHLESEGLLENTVLIVTSDNGTPEEPADVHSFYAENRITGDTAIGRKTWNEYWGTHVPMYVVYDGPDKNFTNGDTVTALVQLVDIYATIAEMTGNHWHDGKSMMQHIASGYTSDPRQVVVSWYNTYLQYHPVSRNGFEAPRSIFHNGQYGYLKEDAEWYDLRADPMLTTPVSQPEGTDYILTEAALHPTITFIYPDVMKAFAE